MKNKRFTRDRILRSAATPREWFRIDKEKETPSVYIYDQIGQDWWGDGISPKDFQEEVKKIKGDKLNVHINSPGGFVYDGYSIYNFLNRLDKHIIGYVDGLAASIASVILMSADEIIMPENAEIMIHDPWSISIGTADNMRQEADGLDSVKDSILGVYASRTGMDRKELSKLMSEETYIKGPEALEMGFATEVEENKKIAALNFDVLFGDKASDDIKNKLVADNKRDLESSLRDAGYSRSEAKSIANKQRDAGNLRDADEDKSDKTEPITIIMR